MGEIEVRIEVKPWRIKSNGSKGKWSRWMEAFVFTENGFGVRGRSVCVPPDKFDFRVGAEIALRDALATEAKIAGWNDRKIVCHHTRKAIWKEFNKVLPKE